MEKFWKKYQKESSEAAKRVVGSCAVLAAVNVGACTDRAGAVGVDCQTLEGSFERAPTDVINFNWHPVEMRMLY